MSEVPENKEGKEGKEGKEDKEDKGTKAKLFINGRSQAVRIPKELAFSGIDAVNVRKEGNAVILTPARKTWESFAELAVADDDFMVIRPRLVKS